MCTDRAAAHHSPHPYPEPYYMTSSLEAPPQVAVDDLGSPEAFLEAIDATIKYFNDGDIVTGTVVKVDRDEVLLDIGYKTEGVIPSKELSIKHDVDPFQVVSVGDQVEALVQQKEDKEGRLILTQLQKGQIRKGVVSSIVNFGAFVDLGGVDGLVHVSELSWKHIDHPSEVVAVGDEVTVEVLDVDMDRERVSLSLKATQEDP